MKSVTEKGKKELLSLKQEEVSISLMSQLFGKHARVKEDGTFSIEEPKYDTRMKMHLNAGEYINLKEVDTTVGSFLFNKLMIEGMLEDIIPNHYYNEVIDKRGFSKLTSIIAEALMMKKLPIQPNLVKWLKQYEFYGLKGSTIFSASYTEGLLKDHSSVIKEKKKLLKEKEIKSSTDMTDIEDALVEKSREVLKHDPGMTLYDSGARGSFGNDYKNMNLMVGPVAIPGKDGEFDFVKSGYIEGIQKEDIVASGNSVVNATHPKAVGTQVSGYKTKQYYAAYQSIQLDDDGTDCHSPIGLPVVLTDDVIESYYYQNIITKDGYETLTSENQKKYLNKKVEIRSPMCCRGDKLCSVCAGRRFYIMGIKNAGLTTGRLPNNMLNASMKNFHIAKVNFDEVDIDNLLL